MFTSIMDIKSVAESNFNYSCECACCALSNCELLDMAQQKFTTSTLDQRVTVLQAYLEFCGLSSTEKSLCICPTCMCQLELAFTFCHLCREPKSQPSDGTTCRCCSYVQFNGDRCLIDMRDRSFEQNRWLDVYLKITGGIEVLDDSYKICQACAVQLHRTHIFWEFCSRGSRILVQKYDRRISMAPVPIKQELEVCEPKVLVDNQTEELKEKYECGHCGGKYKNITYLREHIHWKHVAKTTNNPATYLCSECGQTFELARHLAHHRLKVHSKVRHKCKICEQVYKYSSDLKKHMFKHSGGRIGFVKCPHCSKMLKSEESVAKHIKATHDKFTCNVCHKNYPCQFTLFQHRFDHLGYLPYNCTELNEDGVICSYKSKVKDHFRLHLHKVHSLRYDENVHGFSEAKVGMLKKITEEKQTAHAGKAGPNHKCDKCSSSFQTYTGLHHHKQRAHLQVSYDCRFCDKTFTQKPSLWTHSFLHRDFYPFNCTICSYTVRNKKSMQLHLKRAHDILYSEAVHGFKRETFDQVIDYVLKRPEPILSNDRSDAVQQKSTE